MDFCTSGMQRLCSMFFGLCFSDCVVTGSDGEMCAKVVLSVFRFSVKNCMTQVVMTVNLAFARTSLGLVLASCLMVLVTWRLSVVSGIRTLIVSIVFGVVQLTAAMGSSSCGSCNFDSCMLQITNSVSVMAVIVVLFFRARARISVRASFGWN